ncbi:response regulator [Stieleria varia]|uniref:Hydrogenase transcriptional regulatory protein hupR1 n=1 Tax=Stieleria varia TaxID=2528005 RepID=A0A5C6A3H0_9BACT|nr:response regulator [Stieleria varia]TWT93887.1 Hydrogenase transcriptional regulatory protein hupR1 [Stieleria varia]
MESITKPAVLIVDDEPDVLFSLTGLLRKDFQVHTAQSGKEALDILNEHPIQVVMTDQRMPTMTGVELMSQVRDIHPSAIRIIFTGYADIRSVVEAINTGGLYRYITKPWDPEDLLEALREAAEHYETIAAQHRVHAELEGYLIDSLTLLEQIENDRVDPELASQLKQQCVSLQSNLQRITDQVS